VLAKKCKLFRATPPVLSIVLCKLKLDEEKSKHARLAQQQWFWPSIFAQFLKVAWQSPLLAKEECNKYVLTTVPCF
jgi:hypothetical protein